MQRRKEEMQFAFSFVSLRSWRLCAKMGVTDEERGHEYMLMTLMTRAA
jgi:hypothetical protein